MAKRRGTDETTSAIAIAAFCLSVASAGFSLFQWWNGEREARITAAIEVSRNYFKDRDKEMSRLLVRTIQQGRNSISGDDLVTMAKYADYLAYVAFLTNKNRLDGRYLADTVGCEILLMRQAMKILGQESDQQMDEFARSARLSCPAL